MSQERMQSLQIQRNELNLPSLKSQTPAAAKESVQPIIQTISTIGSQLKQFDFEPVSQAANVSIFDTKYRSPEQKKQKEEVSEDKSEAEKSDNED